MACCQRTPTLHSLVAPGQGGRVPIPASRMEGLLTSVKAWMEDGTWDQTSQGW
jgi:hypothetical protein